MINLLVAALAVGLASEAETDAQKIIAGALLSASLSLALREIGGVDGR